MSLERLRDDFELLEDWEDRYSYILDLGKQLPDMPENLKTKFTSVDGCMSQVWLTLNDCDKNAPTFFIDSDALIVKGLAAVLLQLFSGKTAQEIVDMDVHDFFSKFGLAEHLSPNRRSGLTAMVRRFKTLAETLI